MFCFKLLPTVPLSSYIHLALRVSLCLSLPQAKLIILRSKINWLKNYPPQKKEKEKLPQTQRCGIKHV